jgi:hypothetical protein
VFPLVLAGAKPEQRYLIVIKHIAAVLSLPSREFAKPKIWGNTMSVKPGEQQYPKRNLNGQEIPTITSQNGFNYY